MSGTVETNRDYKLFSSWMRPLISGSYKEPAAEDGKKSEGKKGSKPLSDANKMRQIANLTVGLHNVSWAIARDLVMARDSKITDNKGLLVRGGYSIVTAIALPVLAISVVVESVVRRIIGSCYAFAEILKPAAPSGKKGSAKADAPEKASDTKKKKKEPKSLLARHVSWVKKNQSYSRRQQAAGAVASLALKDMFSTWFTLINFSYTSSSLRNSVEKSSPIKYGAFILKTLPALTSMFSDLTTLLGENDSSETRFYEDKKAVEFKDSDTKKELLISAEANPLFGPALTLFPSSYKPIFDLLKDKPDQFAINETYEAMKSLEEINSIAKEAVKRATDKKSVDFHNLSNAILTIAKERGFNLFLLVDEYDTTTEDVIEKACKELLAKKKIKESLMDEKKDYDSYTAAYNQYEKEIEAQSLPGTARDEFLAQRNRDARISDTRQGYQGERSSHQSGRPNIQSRRPQYQSQF